VFYHTRALTITDDKDLCDFRLHVVWPEIKVGLSFWSQPFT